MPNSAVAIDFATDADLWALETAISDADRAELMALLGPQWRLALEMLYVFPAAAARTRDGQLLAVFGCHPSLLDAHVGVPWALGTQTLARFPKSLCELGQKHVDAWLGFFPRLENWVSVANKPAVRWLRWLGFNFDPPEPVGFLGEPFCRFHKTRVRA